MEEDLVRLRAELDEAAARAAYAAFVAECALNTVLLEKPKANRHNFLQGQLRALKAGASLFPNAGAKRTRVAGLFAAFCAKWGVVD